MLAVACALGACARAEPSGQANPPPSAIGLFTSLPILWAETDDLRGHLRGDVPPHWVLTALRRHGEVRPLDSMIADAGQGAAPLTGFGLLVMAQPRALAPQENVALDAWVRGGGRLLLFADPMLTEESAFGIGDRRRPQDVVLLSPILDHWKLRLEFDESQPAGERLVSLGDVALPVDLPGRFVVAPGSGHCNLLAEAMVAECRLGKGRVLLVADAAMLARARDVPADGADKALEWLLVRLAR